MSKRVLLVDDDKALVETLIETLESHGFKCEFASDVKQGLEAYNTIKPDVIVTDDVMEDISAGFRFVKQIRTIEKQGKNNRTSILMLSALKNMTGLDFKERVGTEYLPVDELLEKPVNPEKVVSTINHLLK